LPGSWSDLCKPGTWDKPTGSNQEGINQVRTQGRLHPLTGRSVIRGRLLLKYPWKPGKCGLWLHLVTARCQDTFLGEQGKIIDFVQSIPGFQKCDEEDVETWMACDAEDCGFQMLNDDEIVTSVQEESEPIRR
ncbi:uncharacterized protein TNCV_1594181, partial [Trichonephila clavipes]